MITYNQQFEQEIRDIIDANPRNYAKMLKSKGFRGRYENRQHLVDYIYACTPLLDDKIHSFKTRLYWTLNHIQDFPTCMNESHGTHKMTEANVKKLNEGYPHYCNSKCLHEDPKYFEHIKECMRDKYGVDNAFQIESVKNDLKERKDEILTKREITLEKHFGTSKGWNLKKSILTRVERYGSAWNQEAVRKTKLFLHGNENWNNPIKNFLTKKRNGTTNTSKPEDTAYTALCDKFGNDDVLRLFKSEKYPFACDFYITSLDMYIECNFGWTHGGHLFNPDNTDDIAKLEKWKSKNTKYYDNAIDTWTRHDKNKILVAKENNINYKIFWTLDELKQWISTYSLISSRLQHLDILKNDARLLSDFNYFKTKKVDKLLQRCKSNYIIKCFQQDTFFKTEKEMWFLSRDLREQLIANRVMHLNKNQDDLTVEDMLASFKISGTHYGYSHFNPFWFKWFINKFNVKTCYDPCGGWGHRLLGSQDLDLYIYNDLSKSTKENVDKMIEYFNIANCHTYNNDARDFIPTEDFEAMFTCPPYFNLEHYECGDFKDYDEYEQFIDKLFEVFKIKKTCKTFGIVVREDLLPENHQDYVEKFNLNVLKTHLVKNLKHNDECLFIFNKQTK